MAGAEAVRSRASVLVIVDVLSFSTALDVAASRGAVVVPFAYGDKSAAQAAANHVGAALAQPRQAADGQLSLFGVRVARFAGDGRGANLMDMIEAEFLDDVRENPVNAELLLRLRSLDLRECHLTAGCLFQTIWNLLCGHVAQWGVKDYDVFYFDDTDTSW